MAASKEMETVIQALKANNYTSIHYVDKAQEAVPIILNMIPADASLEMAGSASVMQLGLLELLRKRGNWRMEFPRPGEFPTTRRDILLVSTNAITLDGKLVNTDGLGNRVSGMIFGVKKVILLIGANKIVRDLDEAFKRIQYTISPFHAKYIGVDTPCAKTEKCSDCSSPQRICNVTTIIHKKPPSTDFSIVLTGEDLGLGWDPSWPPERIEKIQAAYRLEMERFRASLPPRD